jgi:hypothetical protein
MARRKERSVIDVGALAAQLRGMNERQIRAFVQNLPSAQGVMRSREVYFYDNVVLKLAPDPNGRCVCEDECFCPYGPEAKRSDGEGQNEAEAALWRNIADKWRPYFAEVYDADPDGLWLIQEKVVPLMGWHQLPLILWDVKWACGIGDFARRNCGWRLVGDDWQPVIFDYGISTLWQEITGETHPSLIKSWRVVQLPDA